jgi:stress-induced morphogen
LKYGIIFWGGESGSTQVLKIQKKVLHVIKSINRQQTCRDIFKKYKILTVTSLYLLEVLRYMKKYNVNIMQNQHIHDYNTRGRHDLHVTLCNTAFFKKSVVNRSIKVYNTLPDSIKTLDSFKAFKSKLKLFLLDHPFYPMNEFYSLK